jgi:phenylpropionate dioxygenase-like ring-hydroxylating dioxygenase large terminal subunit
MTSLAALIPNWPLVIVVEATVIAVYCSYLPYCHVLLCELRNYVMVKYLNSELIMIKNLNMKPTGWFHVGWSAEIVPGGVKPMKYFDQDLVAARTSKGELSIFDAHCPHMGAHLGYGGKMKDDCLTCPYHGWRFDIGGSNVLIPYEEGHTINKKLKKWHTVEQHEMIFLWHDPTGGAPREGWLPHLFDHDERPADINDFYPAYSNGAIVYKPGERIHPQMVVENAADSSHFKYTHGAPEDPKNLYFDNSGPIWKSSMGFLSPKTKEVALTTYARNPGIGLSFFIFHHHGSDRNGGTAYQGFNRRLVLSATPVDNETTDLRVTYFFPKDPASPDVMPQHVKDAAAHTEDLFEEDAIIWRHQKFIQRPLFSKLDLEIYTALRKWSSQFYEVEGLPVGPLLVAER